MGKADYLALGDWNAQCDRCGRKRKASTLKKDWQGLMVCPEHFEARHPQDFVRAPKPEQQPEWTRSESAEAYVQVCTAEGLRAIPGIAMPGCAIPSRTASFST